MSGHAMQRPCGGASWKLALLSAFFRLVQKQAMCCGWKKGFLSLGHEVDGTADPFDLGMGWIMSRTKSHADWQKIG